MLIRDTGEYTEINENSVFVYERDRKRERSI